MKNELKICPRCNSLLHWSEEYNCWCCDCGYMEVTE
jgi:hypothetical protein